MASWSDITTLVTPAGTLTFNEATGDTYQLDPLRSSGLGMAKVRAPIDNKGQADGYTLHDFWQEGKHLVLVGPVLIRSATTEAGVVAARNVMTDDMEDKLQSILRATGTLNFGAGGALTVKCDLAADFPGGFLKDFIFGLVTASP